MKNYRRNHQEESALLQEIIRTYRYPDGTLNRIAVFISTLALVLLLLLGHFVIQGIKNIKGMNSVSAAELTLDEIEDYITNSYLEAVDDYTAGDLDEEAAKRQILQHIAEYLTSSENFTEEQKAEILEMITNYVSELNLDEFKNNTTKAINDINNIFNEYMEANDEALKGLRETILAEINSGNGYSDEQLKLLQSLYDSLANLELSHYNSLSDLMSETTNNIQNLTNQAEETATSVDDLTKRVEILEDKTTSENNKDFYFTFDSESEAYGYMIDGEFKPW